MKKIGQVRKSALERDLVFVDLETTGLDPDVHEILEIAAVRKGSNGCEERGRFECLTLPEHVETANPEALAINGYDAERWAKHGVPLEVGLEQFMNICFGGVTLVAHSATFDWGFLRTALTSRRSAGQAGPLLADLDYHIICTASMAWPLVMRGEVEKPKLETLCTFFGVSNVGQHSAMRDVERMIEVYKRLLNISVFRTKPLAFFDEQDEP